jgi:hypothetical protein
MKQSTINAKLSNLVNVNGVMRPLSLAPWFKAGFEAARKQNPAVSGCIGATLDGKTAYYQITGNPTPVKVTIADLGA